MDLSRRKFLSGVAAVTVVGALAPVAASSAQRTRTLVLKGVATRTGEYLYLPFGVPRGVNRIDAKLTKNREDTKVGVGLFDQRGANYQSRGFRGVYGEEKSEFFVSAGRASLAFTPGRIESGTWTVIVPVFRSAGPTEITATVRLSFGTQGTSAFVSPEGGIVKPGPAWFKGDLHCHTVHSSDAFSSGTALTPAGWADVARDIGLDWISLTDHNVTTQNRNLPRDSAGARALQSGIFTGPVDVLLLGGEEMTNWFHGHATVTGLPPGAWLDWRQRPGGVPLDTPEEARIGAFLAAARRLGVYTAAAHPFGAQLSWQFFADAERDPLLLPDGLEVWTGPFQPDDETTLKKWDDLLRRGIKIFANGGSDTHGVENTGGFAPGNPTTVVYADSLSRDGIVEALKKGRGFVTRTPQGAEPYLSATGPSGQRQIVGGTIYGAASDTATFSVLVRKGAGMRLVLLRDGTPVQTTPITRDEQTVKLEGPIGTGGYVRAELRATPVLDPTNPIAGRLDMEALTNPIFLANGEPPVGNESLSAPPSSQP